MIPRPIWISAGLGALTASLCCMGPLILAALGIVSIPMASRLADRLFWGYWWVFVSGGLAVASVGAFAFRRQLATGCAVDAGAHRYRRLRNLIGLTVLLFALAYVVWDFVVVEAAGIWMGTWSSPLTHGR